jgi:hypothetical protein
MVEELLCERRRKSFARVGRPILFNQRKTKTSKRKCLSAFTNANLRNFKEFNFNKRYQRLNKNIFLPFNYKTVFGTSSDEK